MKVYRYMSIKEFAKFTAGVPMVHVGKFNARTSSNGFCFLAAHTEITSAGESYDFSPVDCISFLSGIVSNDVLVEMEINPELVTKSYGVYADPINQEWGHTVSIDEFCAKSYDCDTFVPCRYAIISSPSNAIWYNL